MGEMIGLPFVFWLAFTLFDFGNIDQLFAIRVIVGLLTICINHNKSRMAKVLILQSGGGDPILVLKILVSAARSRPTPRINHLTPEPHLSVAFFF
jgi:hypothetical protein